MPDVAKLANEEQVEFVEFARGLSPEEWSAPSKHRMLRCTS
jgi:hypothetical protein